MCFRDSGVVVHVDELSGATSMTGQLLLSDWKPVQLSHERALDPVRFAVHETTQEKFAKRWLLDRRRLD